MSIIKGNTVGTTMPRTNYNQTDPSKADYLKGREDILSVAEATELLSHKAEASALEQKAGNIVCSASGENIVVHDSAERSLQSLKIYGKTTQTDTEFSNMGDSGSVVVSSLGANLWKPWGNGQTKNGVTLTVDENGVYTLNGTCTKSVVFTLTNEDLLPAGTYSLSDSAEGSFPNNGYARTQVYFPNIEESLATANNGNSYKPSITLEEPQTYQYRFRVQEGHEYVNCKLYPVLNIGDTALPHEPYREPRTLTVLTPDGLAGLILSDNAYNVGNETYIDADGNYIASDEIDLERGIYIQRINRMVYDGSEDEGWAHSNSLFHIGATSIKNRKYGGMIYASGYTYHRAADENGDCTVSDRLYFYNDTWSADEDPLVGWREHLAENPITVYYVMATPIETVLSAEQIEAFKALYTNYPNTSIINDSGAYMDVGYVADTKTYIDNKFAELASAIANA